MQRASSDLTTFRRTLLVSTVMFSSSHQPEGVNVTATPAQLQTIARMGVAHLDCPSQRPLLFNRMYVFPFSGVATLFLDDRAVLMVCPSGHVTFTDR